MGQNILRRGQCVFAYPGARGSGGTGRISRFAGGGSLVFGTVIETEGFVVEPHPVSTKASAITAGSFRNIFEPPVELPALSVHLLIFVYKIGL